MNNTNLIKIEHFFEVDNRIKKEMYNNVPPVNDEHNTSTNYYNKHDISINNKYENMIKELYVNTQII